MISKEEEIYKQFKLPIEYLTKKKPIDSHLNKDLELTKTIDSSSQPIYFSLFQPKTQLGEKCIHSWNKYFTNDIHFLEESQKLYSTYDTAIDKTIADAMIEKWNTVKNDTNFLEKYHYVEHAERNVLYKCPTPYTRHC